MRPLDTANAAELAAVVDLVNTCYRGGRSWTDESAIVDGLRVTSDRLRCYVSEAHILVAVGPADPAVGAGGVGSPPVVVGVVKTGWTEATVVGPLDAPAYYLGMLAVAPAWQSRGLGGALADQVEAAAADAGAPRVVMDVLDVRAELLAWYGRRGYVRTGGGMAARQFIEGNGGRLLVECGFVVLEKRLSGVEVFRSRQ